jgi:hypothetical protein
MFLIILSQAFEFTFVKFDMPPIFLQFQHFPFSFDFSLISKTKELDQQ